MNEEWNLGFEAGMKWCEELSKKEDGFETAFWPTQNGTYRNGYAEGTISGGSKFNVAWMGVKTIDGNWIVKRNGKKFNNA